MKNTAHYFIRVFWSEEDTCFVAEVPELKGCSGLGKTESDAIKEAKKSIQNWLSVAKKEKIPIPTPIDQTTINRLNLRVPSDLVKKVQRKAKESGLSVNQLIMNMLYRYT